MPKKKTKKPSLKSRIHKVAELPLKVTALFYGRSGSGKTTLAGTFPGRKLFMDIGEKGTDSVSNIKNTDVLNVESWDDIEDYYWGLESGELKYDTVIIDSVHALQDLAITRVKTQNNKKPEEQTTMRDYGMAAGLLKTWIINYRDLQDIGIEIVFIAHERVNSEDVEDDEILMPEVGPRMMPSVASTLNGAVNVIGHTYIKESITKSKKLGGKLKREVSYCLRLGPHGCYTTKIRSPKDREVPDFITNPDYDKLVEIITGSSTKSAKTTKRKSKKVK